MTLSNLFGHIIVVFCALAISSSVCGNEATRAENKGQTILEILTQGKVALTSGMCRATGARCMWDDDCCGACDGGFCSNSHGQGCYGHGDSCVWDDDCCSGHCDSRVCSRNMSF